MTNNRKGPTVANDEVRIRHPHTLQEREVSKAALPFFTNQGYQVLDSAGRVNTRSTANQEK